MSFSQAQLDKLRKLYTGTVARQQILSAFPGETWTRLRGIALRHGWKRGVAYGNQYKQKTSAASAKTTKAEQPPVDVQVRHDREMEALRGENKLGEGDGSLHEDLESPHEHVEVVSIQRPHLVRVDDLADVMATPHHHGGLGGPRGPRRDGGGVLTGGRASMSEDHLAAVSWGCAAPMWFEEQEARP